MKTKMNQRNDFTKLLLEMGLKEAAVEVGVAEGYFSWHLLENWPGRVHLIDPWRVLDVPGYSVHGDNDQEARYQRILKIAETKYKGRAFVRRGTSAERVEDFRDGVLDFVYIDANHTYEAAQEDTALWYPKVKSGGILAGHDYLDGVFHGQDYGVKRAVTEFAAKHKLEVGHTLETDWPSWWVVKP